ncbi:MAG: Stage 0 sporulation protein J [Chlamydiae bacterium]|nr:Stage 0 sporulation protein J [Chlamydiota bacterium]
MTHQTVWLSVEEIKLNPNQPRSEVHFDKEKLQELADSIRHVGLLQPPLVRALENKQYELVAGERRLRAAKIAGLKEIPVWVQNQNDRQSALSALIENLQREDLNPMDTAAALHKTCKEYRLTHQELADHLGMKRASLSNQIRLLSLPLIIQKALIKNDISVGHAKLLLSLKNETDCLPIFQVIVRESLSVRQTEELLRKRQKNETSSSQKMASKKNIFLQQIENRLQEKFGTKVCFKGNEQEGILSLHYYNLSDLNRLLNEIGYSEE